MLFAYVFNKDLHKTQIKPKDLHLQTQSPPPLPLFFIHPHAASLWSVCQSFLESLPPRVTRLLLSHHAVFVRLLTKNLALTLPVASKTRKPAPTELRKPSSALTPNHVTAAPKAD